MPIPFQNDNKLTKRRNGFTSTVVLGLQPHLPCFLLGAPLKKIQQKHPGANCGPGAGPNAA